MEWVVNTTPRPLYPREREPVPTVQEASQGQAERLRKICSPLGFDHLTSQPLASRYTEYAIPALEETTTPNKVTSSILFSKWGLYVVTTVGLLYIL
jgi:hypothetical protein